VGATSADIAAAAREVERARPGRLEVSGWLTLPLDQSRGKTGPA
jgi:hypothetical protein